MHRLIHHKPYSEMSDNTLIELSEELKDKLTPNGRLFNELEELLEVERELTLREE